MTHRHYALVDSPRAKPNRRDRKAAARQIRAISGQWHKPSTLTQRATGVSEAWWGDYSADNLTLTRAHLHEYHADCSAAHSA